MDRSDLLEVYKFLIGQQMSASDIEEEEELLDELDVLWLKMTADERLQAERYITETLPH